ncbi:MAG: heme-binding protein [Actinobacteria bacterium]|uniref:Unannotated protein n=1 Tax=freshwater metagenome TaxID=449393 RepID=A0A6J7E143_9ZZZZ|nr:heme-binding protein [Actinomycetota bacterium]MSZ38877.1 heme-binding protein [Actinomycetota bacterium]MUH53909.1 heme-binding protein [Actinomycetota bacterium]
MTEEAKYTVMGRLDGVEFRTYEPHVLVSVTVPGSFESAPSYGFSPLVRYISGENRGGEKIAMTAPVFHVAESESEHTISFVLPRDTSTAPSPARADVTTHQVPEITVAAVRFTGGWREGRVKRYETELHQALSSMAVRETGAVMFARYDPPWKPGILRRNEVLIPVDAATIPPL